MANTINTTVSLDAMSTPTVPAPGRRQSEVGERFDDHLDRALERQPESSSRETDTAERQPSSPIDHASVARSARARIDRQRSGRRAESQSSDDAVADRSTADDKVDATTAAPRRVDHSDDGVTDDQATTNPVTTPAAAVIVAVVVAPVPLPSIAVDLSLPAADAGQDVPVTAEVTEIDGATPPPGRGAVPAPSLNSAAAVVGADAARAAAIETPTDSSPAAPALSLAGPAPAPGAVAAKQHDPTSAAKSADAAAPPIDGVPAASTTATVTPVPGDTASVAAATAGAATVAADLETARLQRSPIIRASRLAADDSVDAPEVTAVGPTGALGGAAATAAGSSDDAAPSAPQPATSTSAFAAAAADADAAATSFDERVVAESTTSFTSTEAGLGVAKRAGAHGLPVSVPSLSMDLSDEGLGPLTLQATNGAGQLHLKLTAGDRMVGDMLARAGGELRRDLESNGTSVGSLDIGHSASNHSASDHSGGNQTGAHQAGDRTAHQTTPGGPGAGRSAGRGVPAAAHAPSLQPSPRTPGSVLDGVDVRI